MEVKCYNLNGEILNFDATSDEKLELIISKEPFPGSEELYWWDPYSYVDENICIELPLSKEVAEFFNGQPTVINYKIKDD